MITKVRCPRSIPSALDVCASGLGDPQPVKRQQRDQRMLPGWSEPSGDQQRTELIAVQGDSVGLVIQTRPPHMRSR